MSWLGWSLVGVICYMLVSNTLWLLLGSKLIQSLPGVNIQGFGGTLKIAAWILLSIIGVGLFSVRFFLFFIGFQKIRPVFRDEVSAAIKAGARRIARKAGRNADVPH